MDPLQLLFKYLFINDLHGAIFERTTNTDCSIWILDDTKADGELIALTPVDTAKWLYL